MQRTTFIERLSIARIAAVIVKELLQLRRDRLTFAMIVGVPILQLVLFGFAINADPKHLPAAVVALDQSPYVRSIVRAAENTGYFRLIAVDTEARAEHLLAGGEIQFAFVIPSDFTHKLTRGERPPIAIYADASDPAASGNAIAALAQLPSVALAHDLAGPLAQLAPGAAPFEFRVQRRYNPEGITSYNIVPGLMGTILTMTMIMMTGLAMTRERERGTLENLLATPVRPLEMMIGKIVPFILIGYLQVLVILLAAKFLFAVPLIGSLTLLTAATLIFITANLSVGFTFSTLAQNQLQAMQMTFFFFLPNILLSGFMFPFRGMPQWAQAIGEVFPLTHFLRIVRGILLKGNAFHEIAPQVWPMLLFMLVAGAIALKRYRQTLD